MRVRAAFGALGVLLLMAGPALAQTEEIQKQINKKLEGMRKDRASLEELLAEALKNNPDIRVAESKVREAEAELYRARINTLNRVVMKRNEIASAKAAADEATSRYEREMELHKRGTTSAPEVSAARAAMLKFQADLAVKEAELDLLIGKHKGRAAGRVLNDTKDLHDAPRDVFQPAEARVASATLSPAMVEKIRKALDTPFKSNAKGPIAPSEMLDLLREQTKGVNVVGKVEDDRDIARPNFPEPIPLGALYQWAEDQFGWRFIVRDYGIVAVGHESLIPPGAVLLLKVWRSGQDKPG